MYDPHTGGYRYNQQTYENPYQAQCAREEDQRRLEWAQPQNTSSWVDELIWVPPEETESNVPPIKTETTPLITDKERARWRKHEEKQSEKIRQECEEVEERKALAKKWLDESPDNLKWVRLDNAINGINSQLHKLNNAKKAHKKRLNQCCFWVGKRKLQRKFEEISKEIPKLNAR